MVFLFIAAIVLSVLVAIMTVFDDYAHKSLGGKYVVYAGVGYTCTIAMSFSIIGLLLMLL